MNCARTMLLAVLIICSLSIPKFAGAQVGEKLDHSLEKRGYQLIPINAAYSFYNDLDHATDTGEIKNVTAGYRLINNVYEFIVDLGPEEEIWFMDIHEFFNVGSIADGITFHRSLFWDGREEIMANITIKGQTAVYLGEKEIMP